MSTSRRPAKGARKARSRPSPPVDFWRAVPDPPVPEPIRPADEPGAMLRSLGTPPLPGHAAVAEHYLAAVVERASRLATALAAAAELLPEAEDA